MTCRILLLFILTSCVCASFVVNVTQSSYQAEENHSITLEWRFTTNTGSSPDSLHVYCRLLTLVKPFVLFHVHEGVELPESQDKHFAGRVQWDKDVFREGRVRLHVSRLRTADSGLYRCDVYTSYGTDFGKCWLNITAARDRPEPSPTESPPQPERRGRIGLYCALGLMAAALLALSLNILRRKSTDMRRKLFAALSIIRTAYPVLGSRGAGADPDPSCWAILESLINLIACLWTVGGSRRTLREPTLKSEEVPVAEDVIGVLDGLKNPQASSQP